MNERIFRGNALSSLALGSLLIFFGSGCALDYQNSRSGQEHLWGLGQFQFSTNWINTDLGTVTTGSQIPGLCMQLGANHFGFSFGYTIRQETVVVDLPQLGATRPIDQDGAIHWGLTKEGVWGFGHLSLKSVPGNQGHHAVISGRALAGLGLRAGAKDNSITLALDQHQQTSIFNENMQITFDQDASSWPGFNFFAMQIKATTLANSKSTPTLP